MPVILRRHDWAVIAHLSPLLRREYVWVLSSGLLATGQAELSGSDRLEVVVPVREISRLLGFRERWRGSPGDDRRVRYGG